MVADVVAVVAAVAVDDVWDACCVNSADVRRYCYTDWCVACRHHHRYSHRRLAATDRSQQTRCPARRNSADLADHRVGLAVLLASAAPFPDRTIAAGTIAVEWIKLVDLEVI